MKVQVCKGKICGSEKFSKYILTRLENDKKFYNLENVEISECMCLGQCKKGPNVVFDNKIENYLNPVKASEIMMNKKNKKSKSKKKPNNKKK